MEQNITYLTRKAEDVLLASLPFCFLIDHVQLDFSTWFEFIIVCGETISWNRQQHLVYVKKL